MDLLKHLCENVIDLGARRHTRIDQITELELNTLDHAIAAAIDGLIAKGVPNKTAIRRILRHLSDIVQMADLEGIGIEEENEQLKREIEATQRQVDRTKPWPADEEKRRRSREHQEQQRQNWNRQSVTPEGKRRIENIGRAWSDYGKQRRDKPTEWTGD